MRKTVIIIISALSLSLAACEEGRRGETGGTLAGAAAGAVIGSEVGGTFATVVGAIAGGYLGGRLGKTLDNKDRSAMQSTTQSALERAPTGQTQSWRNPDTGHSGSVTPQEAYRNTEGQPCREYQETVTAGGETQTGYRTACRQSDGTWVIVSK